MKKQFLLTVGISLFLMCTAMPTFAQVSNDNEDGVNKVDERVRKNDFVPGQVLVKMKDSNPASVRRAQGKFRSAGISSLDQVLSKFDVEEMEQLLPNAKVSKIPRRAKAYNGATIVERDLTQIFKISLSKEKLNQTLQLVDELKALDEVEFAEPNYKVFISAEDHIADSYNENPLTSQQWYLDNYGVKELWNKPVIKSKRPVIAIIDTGVDLTHPDLVDNLWTNTAEAEGAAGYDNDKNGFKGDVHGWDFINNTPNIRDNNMHGTHVAGIAAAANNGVGIIGANPQALIMPITVIQSDGSGDVATLVKGIDYAVNNGADILNLSLGAGANSRSLRLALERAYQTTVIVAAAGNVAHQLILIVDFLDRHSLLPIRLCWVLWQLMRVGT
jgi:subtilisin family serine protease